MHETEYGRRQTGVERWTENEARSSNKSEIRSMILRLRSGQESETRRPPVSLAGMVAGRNGDRVTSGATWQSRVVWVF